MSPPSFPARLGRLFGLLDPSHASSDRVQKLAFFGLFQVAQAFAIAPLLFLSPALLARAGLYTVGVVGSLAYVGATAKQDKFLYLGGPILAGIVVVALTSLAPMILPRTAVRSLAVTEAICLVRPARPAYAPLLPPVISDTVYVFILQYGGLAVFSAAILFDCQKILLHARQAAMGGAAPLDPVAESISVELHVINIWVRIVSLQLHLSGSESDLDRPKAPREDSSPS